MWKPLILTGVAIAPLAFAQQTQDALGQPRRNGSPGTFEVVGQSLVSAQQLFLGHQNAVYFLDKVENNPNQINGHPAWGSEWRLSDDQQRPLNVVTNSFCAGGGVLGNGTWINVGGNQAVTWGGNGADVQDGSSGPYFDADGRQSMLDPCTDQHCDWRISPHRSDQRWYPTLETLEDGSIIILGGCRNGGYVNDQYQDNPTYEFFPPTGGPIRSPVLARNLPVNLYPLVWLLPSGKLLLQANYETILLDRVRNQEIPLDNMPDAVRVYPASAGTIMLPLTPDNGYTATVLFCGGSSVATERWQAPDFIAIQQAPSTSCVKITPDVSGSYTHDDPLPEARSMLNFIHLPDGTILGLNGAGMGTAGYGNVTWAQGQSYADNPVMAPILYNPKAPAGQKFSRNGFQASNIPRMYHSSATLLPDGSVMVSGSNPNSDYNAGVKFSTEYRTELFYPSYFGKSRPQPKALPTQLSYGGPSFDVHLSSDDLAGNVDNVNHVSAVVIRTGFSTHAMNMGQRYVELATSFTGYQSNHTATLHVSQLPPNAAVLAPGPALLFIVVNGVPSVGVHVMVGSGQIGPQQIGQAANLPGSQILPTASTNSKENRRNGAISRGGVKMSVVLAALSGVVGLVVEV
ncbi:copper radical oxidase [Coprinellus micaceus]|uniref:Copper radical oxidase n=1 Tax=Coprinellus micaceus TaxID=71717 RepID=A0A4Y7S080_COPMI|nr:copper radical oxidase [Coprinellus micaceus]